MKKIYKNFSVMMISFFLLILPFSAGADDMPETGLVNNNGEEQYLEDDIFIDDDIYNDVLETYEDIADPLEPINRIFFKINDKFYFIVFKPIARGYNAVVHEKARIAMRNAFDNAGMPIRFINSLLQGKVNSAGVELFRFLLNSTLGLAGFFDVAEKELSLQKHETDLGLTLGRYGLGNGFFIIWPILGPSSLRDSIGFAGDGFLYPINYIPDQKLVLGLTSYDHLNENSLRIGQYEDLKSGAIDPYSALKEAYIQNRQYKIEN